MTVLAYSTAPLRRAVVHELTVGSANPRIPTGRLFERTWPSEVVASGVPKKDRGAVWVSVRNHQIVPTMEMTDRRQEVVLVVVTAWYYAGSELHLNELDRQMDLLDEDQHIIRSALALPGALERDPRDRDVLTGLDGGSLRTDGYSSIGPDTVAIEDRLLRVIHTFRATVELAQPKTR